MEYTIAVSWTMVSEVKVHAKSLKEAIKLVDKDDGTIVNTSTDGSYLDDSFEVNIDVTNELNHIKTNCDSGCPICYP